MEAVKDRRLITRHSVLEYFFKILGTSTYLIKFGASAATNGETRLKVSAFYALK
jgi:hypothetical protein